VVAEDGAQPLGIGRPAGHADPIAGEAVKRYTAFGQPLKGRLDLWCELAAEADTGKSRHLNPLLVLLADAAAGGGVDLFQTQVSV
jgi:hypothetical protein